MSKGRPSITARAGDLICGDVVAVGNPAQWRTVKAVGFWPVYRDGKPTGDQKIVVTYEATETHEQTEVGYGPLRHVQRVVRDDESEAVSV